MHLPDSPMTQDLLDRFLSPKERVAYDSLKLFGNITQLKVLNAKVTKRSKDEVSCEALQSPCSKNTASLEKPLVSRQSRFIQRIKRESRLFL